MYIVLIFIYTQHTKWLTWVVNEHKFGMNSKLKAFCFVKIAQNN